MVGSQRRRYDPLEEETETADRVVMRCRFAHVRAAGMSVCAVGVLLTLFLLGGVGGLLWAAVESGFSSGRDARCEELHAAIACRERCGCAWDQPSPPLFASCRAAEVIALEGSPACTYRVRFSIAMFGFATLFLLALVGVACCALPASCWLFSLPRRPSIGAGTEEALDDARSVTFVPPVREQSYL